MCTSCYFTVETQVDFFDFLAGQDVTQPLLEFRAIHICANLRYPVIADWFVKKSLSVNTESKSAAARVSLKPSKSELLTALLYICYKV